MIAPRILQEQLFTIVENGEMYLGIPHRLVGVIDHELVAVDGIGEIVGYGGQLQCGDRTAKHHTALRLFFLPFSDSLYRLI